MKDLIRSLKSGLGELVRVRRLLLLILGAALLLAAVPARVLQSELKSSLGKSGVSETLKEGYDDLWFREWDARAGGSSSTFHPTLAGPGAIFHAFEDFIEGDLWRLPLPIVALGLASILLWVCASGGLLGVAVAGRPVNWLTFVTAAATYSGRFFRIFLVSLTLYATLYLTVILGWVPILGFLAHDLVDERAIFLLYSLKYLWLLAGLFLIGLLSGAAKVVTVEEDRQSILLAFFRALGSLRRASLRWISLAFVFTGLVLLLFLLYGVFAPDARLASWPELLFLVVMAQILLFGRIAAKAGFLLSGVHLYRSTLPELEQKRVLKPQSFG